MKSNSTIHSFVVLVCLLFRVNIQAQFGISLNEATAETLPTLIPDTDDDQITSLTLAGYLNDTDIKFIRERAGLYS